jgi:S-adenosylmethionine:diacylglycerol 3-amino-3-carboxypropyl transferase
MLATLSDRHSATSAVTDAGLALSLIWELGQLRSETAFTETRRQVCTIASGGRCTHCTTVCSTA